MGWSKARRVLATMGALATLGAIPSVAPAQPAGARVRVVDVGNGLCVVIHTPDGHSMLYDAGLYDPSGDKSYCRDAVNSLVPESKIDLIVLSHSDSDHIGELPNILEDKLAGTILYPGDHHLDNTDAINREIVAINAAKQKGATIWSLAETALPSPDTGNARVFPIGAGTATVIAGWSDGEMTRHDDEAHLTTKDRQGEHNNALSIVVRFEYQGHSVLLTGDTVGRFRGDPLATCAYAERHMREAAADWPIRSDVIIGQHHGADNASSNCFIRAVAPSIVVFSAGHKNYHHPTQAAADRYTAAKVRAKDMFRTDRSDDEGGGEWIYGSIKGCHDDPGDDDVELLLPASSGDITGGYVNAVAKCTHTTPAFFAKTVRVKHRRRMHR